MSLSIFYLGLFYENKNSQISLNLRFSEGKGC